MLARLAALAERDPHRDRRGLHRGGRPFCRGKNGFVTRSRFPTELIAMVLTLANQPVPKNRPRSVIPACLQARAPLSYELRDERGRRVAPTLAGYKLRRGKTYRLHVR